VELIRIDLAMYGDNKDHDHDEQMSE
jgi:hypothetical protein